MTVPLIGLAVLATLGGALNLPGVHSLSTWLEHALEHVHVSEFDVRVALLSTGLALAALGLAWRLYGRRPLAEGQPDPLRRLLGPIFVGMENKWWVDEVYGLLILRPYGALSRFLAEQVDGRFWHDWFHDRLVAAAFRGFSHWLAWGFDLPVIDGAGAALAAGTRRLAGGLGRLQTGYVRNYAALILVGLVVLLAVFLVRMLG
jgi:NADH-quinone oxidoreductase subunit L